MNEPLDPSEEVILSLKDHWIVLLKPAIFLIFGVILTSLIFGIGTITAPASEELKWLLYMIAYTILLVSVHFFFILLFSWMISNIIVTNKRLIEIKYRSFVMDDINHAEMSKINEVEKIKHGLWKNILNYGDISMSIPGMKNYLVLTHVKKPGKFVDLIEALKLNKPLGSLDLHGIIGNVSPKYSYLKKS